MLLAFSSLTALSFLLLFFAIRGRRIDDHPLCRNCRFDLTGLPPTSDNCPECGHNIRSPHTTTIGHRRPIRPLLITAWLLFIPSLLLSITLLALHLTHTSLIRYEPLFLLNASLTTPATPNSTAALAEITRRLDAGSLSTANLAPTIDKILRLQSDTTHDWDRALGDLVLDAATRSLIDPARWETFLAHSVDVSTELTPLAHQGINPRIEVSANLTRFGAPTSGLSPPTITLNLDTLINGAARHIGPDIVHDWEGDFTLIPCGPDALVANLRIGPHPLTLTYTVDITFAPALPGTATIRGSRPLSFQSVPSSTPLVKMNHDPSVKAAFLRSVSFPDGPTIKLGGDLSFYLRLNHPPLFAWFKVELAQGKRHWTSPANISANPRSDTTELELFNTIGLPSPAPGPAEIVLTPDPRDPDEQPFDPDTHLPITELFAEPLHLPITITQP